jgi:tetraacyldisaccharide 4'-kinase
MAPFSFLYKWIMQFRNHLFDIEYKTVFEFETKIIAVGNLSVGGTGKTPMVEYLIRYFLRLGYLNKITTLSRGYGRKTRGFRLADHKDTAATLGDEPYQMHHKFKGQINVAVGEERVLAVPSILLEHPENKVIILDDAFQHRSVKPNFSICLSTYQRPFYEDYVLPSGRLREARAGVQRADILVITKCPLDISKGERETIQQSTAKYLGHKPVFFTGIQYGEIIPSKENRKVRKDIVLVSGIANSEPLVRFLEQEHTIHKHYNFADHHFYRANELQEISFYAQKHQLDIITTEKDWVKLKALTDVNAEIKENLYYVPMMVQFLGDEITFQQLLEDSLKDQ